MPRRSQVDVEVRGERLGDSGGRDVGAVDALHERLVRRPPSLPQRVPLTQRRPPLLLAPCLEAGGRPHSHEVARETRVVLDDLAQRRVGDRLRPDPQVAEQVGVVVVGARVIARTTRGQADAVERGQVGARGRSEAHHRATVARADDGTFGSLLAPARRSSVRAALHHLSSRP